MNFLRASLSVHNFNLFREFFGNPLVGFPNSPQLLLLFKQLEALTAKDTAALSDLIQKWIDTH